MHAIVDGDVPGMLTEVLFHQDRKAINRKHFIRVFRFIQNHRQGWPTSPSGVYKNADGSDLLVFEILLQYLFRCFRDMDH